MPNLTDDVLKQQLLNVRPGVSGLERGLVALDSDMVPLKSDWVSTWEDTLNVAISGDGDTTATRAITREGRLIWLVRTSRFRRPYHARAAAAEDAFLEAHTAWNRRADFRRNKEEVRRIVHELRFLKVRHDVTVDDAYASALCEEGVDGFLRTLRLSRYRRFPGWLIAWLNVFDKQVGYVLFEARKRHEAAIGGSILQSAGAVRMDTPTHPGRRFSPD